VLVDFSYTSDVFGHSAARKIAQQYAGQFSDERRKALQSSPKWRVLADATNAAGPPSSARFRGRALLKTLALPYARANSTKKRSHAQA
jgi:hypothetical protein